MNRVLRYTSLCVAVIVVALLASGVVFAQAGYPPPADEYVNDYAGVMEQKHEDDLRARLADLDRRTGVEATVLTIASIHDYDTGDATIESFATNLFNTWGIGDAEKNDGLLILVAVRDHRVRIEVGKGYGESLDQPMQRVIDETMVPHFKREDYSTGIYQGTLAAVEAATGDTSFSGPARVSINFKAWLDILIFVVLCFGTPIGLVVLMGKLCRSSSGRRGSTRGGGSRGGSYWNGDGSSGGGGGGGFGGGSSSGGGASGSW
jgi:uncharacterized membrane protein YgcG